MHIWADGFPKKSENFGDHAAINHKDCTRPSACQRTLIRSPTKLHAFSGTAWIRWLRYCVSRNGVRRP